MYEQPEVAGLRQQGVQLPAHDRFQVLFLAVTFIAFDMFAFAGIATLRGGYSGERRAPHCRQDALPSRQMSNGALGGEGRFLRPVHPFLLAFLLLGHP